MLGVKCAAFWSACVLLLASFGSARGQGANAKMFKAVPAAQRERFAARLNQYVEYLLAGRNEKLFELYDEETLCSLCKGKPECMADCQQPLAVEVPEGFSSELIGFKLRNVNPHIIDSQLFYRIDAEQKERVSWKGKPPHVVKKKVTLFAVHENGDWRFSLLSGPQMIWL